MGRWGLTDPELLKALDEDPELVRMVEHLAAENGETPRELLARLLHEQFAKELETAFESPPGSRYRRILAEAFEGEDLVKPVVTSSTTWTPELEVRRQGACT